MRSSSSSPISGDFSTQARVRSSPGLSAARPAATRSITAICWVSSSRSAPATGTPRSLQARITASKKALRERTRIMTSPGRTGRRRRVRLSSTVSVEPGRHRRWIASAMRRATTTGGSPGSTTSTGSFQSPGSGCGARRDGGPDLDEAGDAASAAVWRCGPASVAAEPAGVGRMGEDPVDGVEDGRGRAERQDEVDAVEAAFGVARRASAKCALHGGETCRAGRPGRNRSTASRRRPRRRSAMPVARPAPAKKSSATARRISHCVGRGILRLVDQDVVDAACRACRAPRRSSMSTAGCACARRDRRSRAGRGGAWRVVMVEDRRPPQRSGPRCARPSRRPCGGRAGRGGGPVRRRAGRRAPAPGLRSGSAGRCRRGPRAWR